MILTYLKYALGLASVLLLLLIALLLLFSLPLKKQEPRVAVSDSALPREVRQLDAQIHAGFFSLGISKEDIKSIKTQSRQYQGQTYPFVQEEIILPRGMAMEAVRDLLLAKLKAEFPDAKVDFQGDGLKHMTITVALGTAPTHSLYFLLESEMARASGQVSSARVAIIIDGVEADLRASRELLSLSGPLTFSILFGDPLAKEIASEVYQKGHEVLLRLPLEPSRAFLTMGMSKEEVQEKFRAALRAVPYVKGVNAALSSIFIEDPVKTVLILKEIREAGLYFFDSGQAKDMTASVLAKSLGVKAAERNLIIDNVKDRETTYQQLVKLSHQALKEGWATAVLHPNPVTVSVLKENIPRLKEQGFEVVPLSRIAK